MGSKKILLVIVILLILLLFLNYTTFVINHVCHENLTDQEGLPQVRLYENYNYTGLAYDYTTMSAPSEVRQIIKLNLKSAEIKVPSNWAVEIWAVNINMDTASDFSGFYNSYTEPDYAWRANSAKFSHIITVTNNDSHIQITFPVKKILLLIKRI